tara:strand:+ start:775 stop:1296 length:522 start_codon:yes stop_codon:yes gene_type:complete
MAADWYKEQPTNRNFLNPIGFQLKLENFAGVDFFCQSANLPDIAMPVTSVASPFRSLSIVPGGGVEFGDLNVEFIIDEDLKNYLSIHRWIRANGRADSNDNTPAQDEYTQGQLHILTSSFNPAFVVDFRNMFPINLTAMNFDAKVSDVDYITASVTFKFQEMFVRDKNFKNIS